MSSKKKDKNEWLQCLSCDKFYAKPSLHHHQKSCEAEDDNEESFSYISNDKFFAKLREADNSQNMLPFFKADTILMHPNTLKCANFQISSRVELTYNNTNVVCTVWPCSLTNLEAAVLSTSKMVTLGYKKGLVEIKKFNDVLIPTKVLKFKPSLDIEVSEFEELKDRLANVLDDSIITVGEAVTTVHYGTRYFFNVVENDRETRLPHELFADLSLTEKTATRKYLVSFEKTDIELIDKDKEFLGSDSTSCNIFGRSSQKKEIEEVIIMPLGKAELFKQYGLESQHGVLFYGQSGTGKTSLANSLKFSVPNVHFVMIDSSEIISQYVGEAEDKLKQVFGECIKNQPSILVVDDFHLLCPANTGNQSNDMEKRLISVIAKLMDDIPQHALLFVIGITNSVDLVHPTLRRSGRFDKDIEFTVPNARERDEILGGFLSTNRLQKLCDDEIAEIVNLTHGFVPADLKTLCNEAALIGLRNSIASADGTPTTLEIGAYRQALLTVRPSAMKAVTVDIPRVYWSDVGGQNEVKEKLRESIEWPLKYPETFKRMGISSPKGLLMYGPPGCSKTLIAKALATESGLNFISIKGPELFNKYLGESERAVRDVFKKARAAAPSIIFFDEIDALGIKRTGGSANNTVGDRVLTQLLTELDGVEGLDGVIIVAATNRPDVIDAALLRPGRIDRLIYVPLPDDNTRKEIFAIQFRTIPTDENVSLDQLVSISAGYSGAEICALCREAAMLALREDFNCLNVKQEHFATVFSEAKPGTSSELIAFYDEFAAAKSSN